MFEPAGERPGELQKFQERFDLQPVELATSGLEQTYLSADGQVLAIVAGVGTANCAVSTMALGMSQEVDLSEAYWLISGIAGGNPNTTSLACPVWADYAVDGDLAFEIDSRNVPEDWPSGIIPIGAREPFGAINLPEGFFGRPYQKFRLHTPLIDHVYELTKNLALHDSDELYRERRRYDDFFQLQESPIVLRGDTLSGARFWHGPHHNDWAQRWVKYWTHGEGVFATSGMEDTGTLHAIRHLSGVGLADYSRAMILRTVSNFTMPPPGGDVVKSLIGDGESEANYPGYQLALENAALCGGQVIESICQNWDHYEAGFPMEA